MARHPNPNPEAHTLEFEDPGLKKGFAQVPRAVLKARGLSGTAKLVYALLLDYAWQEDSCFPGQLRLASDLDTSDRTIRTALNELREYGLIRWTQRGLNQTNVYIILSLAGNPRLQNSQSGDSTLDRKKSSGPDRTKSSAQDRKKTSAQDRKKTSAKEYSEDYTQSDEYAVATGTPVDVPIPSGVNHSNSKAHTRKKVQRRAEENGEPLSAHSAPAGMVRLGDLLSATHAAPAAPSTADDMGTKRAEIAEKRPNPEPVLITTTAPTEAAQILTSAPQQAQQKPDARAAQEPEQLAALTATMQTLSEKLGDDRHWRSNVTQARHILEGSGLNPNAWTGLVWSVYHRTAEQQGRLKRPMAWFFRALRSEVSEHTTPKSLHASFTADPPRKSLAGQYEHLVHR